MARSTLLPLITSSLVVCLATGVSKANLSIDIAPESNVVALGGSLDVEILITGLGNGEAPSLGQFDLSVMFDSSIFQFDSVSFGDPVLGDQLALGGSSTSFGEPFAGRVDFGESWSGLGDLDAFQQPDFTLATLTFDAKALGTGNLFLASATDALLDSQGLPLFVGTAPRMTQVSVVPVPAAATLGLIGLGLVVFAGSRFRRHSEE